MHAGQPLNHAHVQPHAISNAEGLHAVLAAFSVPSKQEVIHANPQIS